jgi:hypothetical protein
MTLDPDAKAYADKLMTDHLAQYHGVTPSPQPPPPPPTTVDLKIPASQLTRVGTKLNLKANGAIGYWDLAADRVECTITSPAAQSATLIFEYQLAPLSAKSSRIVTVGQFSGTYVFAGNAAAWDSTTFSTMAATFNLLTGDNKITLAMGLGGLDLLSLTVRSPQAVALKTVTPTPPPPSTTNPSGIAPPVVGAVEGLFRVADVEDFNFVAPKGSFGTGKVPTQLAGRVYPYDDGWKDTAGKTEAQPSLYMPSQVLSVSGGCLVEEMFNSGQGARSAALVIGNYQTAGRYSFAMKVDAASGRGWKIANLLWPDEANGQPWPAWGEIDWPEGSLLPTNVPEAYIHIQNGAADAHDQIAGKAGPSFTFGTWHRFDIEWIAKKRATCFVDGTKVLESTDTTKVPAGRMAWVIQLESNMGGNYSRSGDWCRVLIDWYARSTAV